MAANFASKRLSKELNKVCASFSSQSPSPDSYVFSQINGALPPGISLVKAEDFQEWLLDIKVLDSNPIYLNQTYRLQFKFSPSYPIGTCLSNPQTTWPSCLTLLSITLFWLSNPTTG
jgi:ubiquitin-conjugating enzyme E2 W